jgi:WD40 repeat protein
VGLLCGTQPTVTDPLAAGAKLGRALGDRRLLLVVDDVWTAAQVEPFLVGGPATVRLFTTRLRGVLPRSAAWVLVDAMDRDEAERLLTSGVDGLSHGVVEGLLAATGRWPVLLALVNGAVRADRQAGMRPEDSMRQILDELRTRGPTILDVTDAGERHTAVARTIEASLSRLTVEQRARYLELAVFGEDVAIPGPVLTRYWKATGGWSEFQSRRYCQRLAELALVSDYRHDPERLVLHDVIRAYLREQTHHRRGELARALIDAHRSLVAEDGDTSAWWQLPADESYLWAWLPTHLRTAGLQQELQACLHHPRWLVGKLEYVGPAGLETDLSLCDDPLSRALSTIVQQNAHVLGPLEPPGSLAATLATRLPGDGPTKTTAEQLITGLTTPHLRAVTALPDLPHPALSRILTGHKRAVSVLAFAPDGSWLVSACNREVRIWDPVTGVCRHTLTSHAPAYIRQVRALAVAPDASWLATADESWPPTANGGKVWIWDPATGARRHALIGRIGGVTALAVAPDGSWLATADDGGEVSIWDPATGARRHALTGHTRSVTALAVAPDRSWLATVSHREARIWDPATGACLHTLSDHTSVVSALAVAPDGSWLATASGEEVRIWSSATGACQHALTGHTRSVTALAVTQDGSWLATASDWEVRIWDPVTGACCRILTAVHTRKMDEMELLELLSVLDVQALAIAAGGPWLFIADEKGKIRIWDPTTGECRETLTGHTSSVSALALTRDGSWLATADKQGEIRIWKPVTGEYRHTLTGHTSSVSALALTRDGSWLATADKQGEIRIWKPVTGECHHTLTGHTNAVSALAIAPDGSWLASATDNTDTSWEVRFWDIATGACRHTRSGPDRSMIGHSGWVSALAVAPDGSWLASASGDIFTGGQIRMWDPATGECRHTLTGHARGVTALAVAPDGSWLVSAGDEAFAAEVRVWDPVTGTHQHTFTGHTRSVAALAVAHDGSWLATVGYDGEIRIWDLATSAPLTSLRVADRLLHLQITPTTIVAAGDCGVYFLALCRGTQSG